MESTTPVLVLDLQLLLLIALILRGKKNETETDKFYETYQYDKAGKHTKSAHPFPLSRRSQFAVSPCRIGMGVSPYKELAHHDWQAQQDDAQNIDNDKCRSTVLTSLYRKSPYIRGCQEASGHLAWP